MTQSNTAAPTTSPTNAEPISDLLTWFPEINFVNYGQQEIEALQDWAHQAYDALKSSGMVAPDGWQLVPKVPAQADAQTKVDEYGRTPEQERQRQLDNQLLALIQRHFPSLPVSPGYTDWSRWLEFARAAGKAAAQSSRQAGYLEGLEAAAKLAAVAISDGGYLADCIRALKSEVSK